MPQLRKRNKPKVTDPDPFEVTDEASLRRARLLGQLGLVYQPIVDLRSGDIAGVEALLRWHVPGAETLAADHFAELLESDGTLSATDQQTLQLASVFRARLWGEAERRLPVSVNVPARNLLPTESAVTVLAILDGAGLAPAQLELDLVDVDDALAFGLESAGALRQLHDAGVMIALDGIEGVSEPGVILAALPIDAVKIDVLGSIDDGYAMPDQTLIVRQTKRLGLRLVAKRVETSEQLRVARELGFDHVQGYLLGEPLPADSFAVLVTAPASPQSEYSRELLWAA